MVNLLRQAQNTRLDIGEAERRASPGRSQWGVTTASPDSLRVMISSWENGRQVPDAT